MGEYYFTLNPKKMSLDALCGYWNQKWTNTKDNVKSIITSPGALLEGAAEPFINIYNGKTTIANHFETGWQQSDEEVNPFTPVKDAVKELNRDFRPDNPGKLWIGMESLGGVLDSATTLKGITYGSITSAGIIAGAPYIPTKALPYVKLGAGSYFAATATEGTIKICAAETENQTRAGWDKAIPGLLGLSTLRFAKPTNADVGTSASGGTTAATDNNALFMDTFQPQAATGVTAPAAVTYAKTPTLLKLAAPTTESIALGAGLSVAGKTKTTSDATNTEIQTKNPFAQTLAVQKDVFELGLTENAKTIITSLKNAGYTPIAPENENPNKPNKNKKKIYDFTKVSNKKFREYLEKLSDEDFQDVYEKAKLTDGQQKIMEEISNIRQNTVQGKTNINLQQQNIPNLPNNMVLKDGVIEFKVPKNHNYRLFCDKNGNIEIIGDLSSDQRAIHSVIRKDALTELTKKHQNDFDTFIKASSHTCENYGQSGVKGLSGNGYTSGSEKFTKEVKVKAGTSANWRLYGNENNGIYDFKIFDEALH